MLPRTRRSFQSGRSDSCRAEKARSSVILFLSYFNVLLILRQVFAEAGGDEGDTAGNKSAGEKPRRRAIQVRGYRASRRQEESPGTAAEAVRPLHDMLHIRHHRQSEGRYVDASEHHGGQLFGDVAAGRSRAGEQGHSDQLFTVGAYVGALLREYRLHDGRLRRLL